MSLKYLTLTIKHLKFCIYTQAFSLYAIKSKKNLKISDATVHFLSSVKQKLFTVFLLFKKVNKNLMQVILFKLIETKTFSQSFSLYLQKCLMQVTKLWEMLFYTFSLLFDIRKKSFLYFEQKTTLLHFLLVLHR